MPKNFLDYVKNRRSLYDITAESPLDDTQLQTLLETALLYVPSAFNCQATRAVLLLGARHKKLWEIVLDTLREIVPPARFAATEEKITGFAAGYGTILFFDEMSTIQQLQKDYASYATQFPVWAHQGQGMAQFTVWTALESEGLGASLQHYNPLIDEAAAKEFGLPASWRLAAQMPFGRPTAPAGEKDFLPIEERVRVLGS